MFSRPNLYHRFRLAHFEVCSGKVRSLDAAAAAAVIYDASWRVFQWRVRDVFPLVQG
jgi:hypothetical protein